MPGVRVAASLAVISALLVASSASTHRRPGGCWSSSGSSAMWWAWRFRGWSAVSRLADCGLE